MKTPGDTEATPVNIDINITWNGTQPTYSFSGNNVSSDGTIDLSALADAANIQFSLVSAGGEMFEADHAIAVMPMNNPNNCPAKGSGHASPVFSDPTVSDTRRALSITDHNGSSSGQFKYALFMTNSNNQPIAACDPVIINR